MARHIISRFIRPAMIGAALVVALPFFHHEVFHTRAQQNLQGVADTLAPGQRVPEKVETGEKRSFKFALSQGQFAKISFDSVGDFETRIIAPDGSDAPQTCWYNLGSVGCFLSAASMTGFYQIAIRQIEILYDEEESIEFEYTIEYEELREATSDDLRLIRAMKGFNDVSRLHGQRKAESYREAIETGIKIVPLWQEVGNPVGEAYTLYYIGESYETIGEYQEALDYFNRAMPITRVTNSGPRETDILVSTGQTYQYLSQYQKALDC